MMNPDNGGEFSLDKTLPLLQAIGFASRRHLGQFRKDKQTPYASHVFRVAMIACHVFGVDDPQVLTAAALHDTIEDTPTDYDDIAETFGDQVAGWVVALTKNNRVPDEVREDQYRETLAHSPWQVQICKLADMLDNLIDSGHLSPQQRERTHQRLTGYLEAIRRNLRPEARNAWEIVKRQLDQSLTD